MVGQYSVTCIEEQRAIDRAGQGPFAFHTQRSDVSPLAHLEQYARPVLQCRGLTLQEVIEKLQLPGEALRLVVLLPLLAAVHLQPLLGRCQFPICLQSAAGMQAVI